jgi:DNA-binding IclR family transcriptional regulator
MPRFCVMQSCLVSTCRRDGFVAKREENELGAHFVAAPVFRPGSDVIAAVSVAEAE